MTQGLIFYVYDLHILLNQGVDVGAPGNENESTVSKRARERRMSKVEYMFVGGTEVEYMYMYVKEGARLERGCEVEYMYMYMYMYVREGVKWSTCTCTRM